MRRHHPVVLAERSWIPKAVRDALDEHAAWAMWRRGAWAPAAPLLAEALRAAGTRDVVDLCAGGGEPWRTLLPALNAMLLAPASAHGHAQRPSAGALALRVHLTHSAPDHAALARAELASGPAVRGELCAVHATRVPASLRGLRTVFAFERFAPAEARVVLADAVRHAQPIVALQCAGRGVVPLALALTAPLSAIVGAPLVRPFRWTRLAWSWLLPVVPVAALWDELARCARTYTTTELLGLAAGLGEAEGWTWRAGMARGAVPVTWLVGMPGGGVRDEV